MSLCTSINEYIHCMAIEYPLQAMLVAILPEGCSHQSACLDLPETLNLLHGRPATSKPIGQAMASPIEIPECADKGHGSIGSQFTEYAQDGY